MTASNVIFALMTVGSIGLQSVRASAAEAGIRDAATQNDAETASITDAEASLNRQTDAGEPRIPLACGGALCKTTTGSTCSLSRPAATDLSAEIATSAAAAACLLLGIVRRRRYDPAGRLP